MANKPMKLAMCISDSKEIVSIENYNENKHKGKLFCVNGCDVKVHLRRLQKQNTKSFCANRKNLNKHTESCIFKNKCDEVYNKAFNEEFGIKEKSKDIFNSLMRTAKYKMSEKKKHEKIKEKTYIEELDKTNGKKLIYIDADKISDEDLGEEKKVFGIFREREYLGAGAKYLYLKTNNIKAICFKAGFFENQENITLEEFDKLYNILKKNKFDNKITAYGKIENRREPGFNIVISDIEHIVINALPIREIINRNGFKKL